MNEKMSPLLPHRAPADAFAIGARLLGQWENSLHASEIAGFFGCRTSQRLIRSSS